MFRLRIKLSDIAVPLPTSQRSATFPPGEGVCFADETDRQISVYRTVALSYDAVGRGFSSAPAASAPPEQRKNLATLHEFALERYKFDHFLCRREQAPALRW